jgi:hypothetical protein
MFRVYDAETGKPLSFKYSDRAEAEHVESTIQGRKTLTLPCNP